MQKASCGCQLEANADTALPAGQHVVKKRVGSLRLQIKHSTFFCTKLVHFTPHLPGRFSGRGCLSGLLPALLAEHRTWRLCREVARVHSPRLIREVKGFSLGAASVAGVNFSVTAMSADCFPRNRVLCQFQALCVDVSATQGGLKAG